MILLKSKLQKKYSNFKERNEAKIILGNAHQKQQDPENSHLLVSWRCSGQYPSHSNGLRGLHKRIGDQREKNQSVTLL